MEIDSLAVDMHFSANQVTAEQVIDDQRGDAALPARRILWILDGVTHVRREGIRTPGRPYGPFNARQRPCRHGGGVPQPTDNRNARARQACLRRPAR